MEPCVGRVLGVLEEAGGRLGGCSSYLREQVVGNEGRDLARQDLTGHGKDSGFCLRHDEKRV